MARNTDSLMLQVDEMSSALAHLVKILMRPECTKTGEVQNLKILYRPNTHQQKRSHYTQLNWQPLGNATWSMFWLNRKPKVKLCKPLGHVPWSMFWLKLLPKVKLCNPLGNATRS